MLNLPTQKIITKSQLMFLCAILLVAVIWMPAQPPENALALCSGSGCQGYDPYSKGCDADAIMGPVKNIGNGSKAQNRYSNACNAEWERTVQGFLIDYASGTIRWNPSAFTPYYHVYSPAPIAEGQVVYTSTST
jgi:hypothetical protein